MMTSHHPFNQEELMAYVDGELTPTQTSEAAEHLQACDQCQRFVAELRGLSGALATWEVALPEFRLPDQAIQPSWNLKSLFTRWPRTFVVLGAAAALVLVALTLQNTRLARPTSLERTSVLQQMAIPRTRAVRNQSYSVAQSEMAAPTPAPTPAPSPLIAKTAELTLETKDSSATRAALEAVVRIQGGYVSELSTNAPVEGPRVINATVNFPADRFDAAIVGLRALGRVVSENRRGTDVTEYSIDLGARLSNARGTEQRLKELERQSTGKLSDVLSVEKEIARIREDIERMEAETKSLKNRVSYSSVHVIVSEEVKTSAQALPGVALRLRNAAVEGYRNIVEAVVGCSVFLLSYAPVLLLWAAIAYGLWRAWRWVKDRRFLDS